MDKIKYLTQQEYDTILEFKSLKDVYKNFKNFRPNRYWLKRNSKWFGKWEYVQRAYRDVNKANYNQDTIYFVMSE